MTPLRGVHRAKVTDNNDPKKLRRVKVEIKGIFEGDSSKLPWVFPKPTADLGGGYGFLCVPEKDLEIVVEFPLNNPYAGFYTSYTVNSLTHHADLDDDYPNTWGFLDSTGFKIKINKQQKKIDIVHPSGYTLSLDSAGKLTTSVPSDEEETVGGKKTETITGKYKVKADGTIEHDGGGGNPTGVVTKDCMCILGVPHPMFSATVKSSL
jgi:hypothetical protein